MELPTSDFCWKMSRDRRLILSEKPADPLAVTIVNVRASNASYEIRKKVRLQDELFERTPIDLDGRLRSVGVQEPNYSSCS